MSLIEGAGLRWRLIFLSIYWSIFESVAGIANAKEFINIDNRKKIAVPDAPRLVYVGLQGQRHKVLSGLI